MVIFSMDTLWNTGPYRREDSWLPVIVDTNYHTMKTTTIYTTDLYINKHCMHVAKFTEIGTNEILFTAIRTFDVELVHPA